MNTQPQPNGYQLSLIGAQAAADRADRVTGGTWSQEAWEFLVKYGRKAGTKHFMAEDVRAEAERTQAVPTPPDRRAWGQIIRKAAMARLITKVGHAANKDRTCHGSPKAVWLWSGC